MRFFTTIITAVISAICPSCIGLPSGDDADQASHIYKALAVRYPFPSADAERDEGATPQAYCRPRSNQIQILIYGVRTQAGQDRVIAILEDIQATQRTLPILVTFYANDRINVGTAKEIRKVIIEGLKRTELLTLP
jgi:hypothetical protein